VLENASKTLEEVLSLLALARESREEVGVSTGDDRNIIKQENKPTNLDTREKGIISQIATIIGEVLEIGKFQKGPIAKRLDVAQPKLNDKVTTAAGVPSTKETKTSTLMKWVAAGLGVMAAAYAFFEALGPIGRFFTTTAFKNAPRVIIGLLKNVSKVFGYVFNVLKSLGNLKMFGNIMKIGKAVQGFTKTPIMQSIIGLVKGAIKGPALKLLNALKFLPVIGAFVNFGFAIARFKKGEVIPAIVELISGLFSIASIFSFGAGGVISAILDGVLLLYDLEKEKGNRGGAPLTIDENSGFIDKMKYYFVEKITPILRYIPVISSLFYWADSLKAFQSGDVKEGLKQLGWGFLALLPVPGLVQGIQFVMSMFNSRKEENKEKFGEEGPGFWGIVGDMLADVWKSFTKKLGEWRDAAWDRIKQFGNWVKSLNPFSGDKDPSETSLPVEKAIPKKEPLTPSQQAELAERAGHSSWDEYKDSGWEWKNNNTMQILEDSSKESVTALNKHISSTENINKTLKSQFETEKALSSNQISLLDQINKGINDLIMVMSSQQQSTASQNNMLDRDFATVESNNLAEIREAFRGQTIAGLTIA